MQPAFAEVRPYHSGDRASIISIWRRSSEIGHPFLSSEQLAAQQSVVEANSLDTAEIWVATLGGQPAAFIGLIDGFIGALFVDGPARGTGLGTQLLRHAIQLKGTLSLEVYEQNRQAIGFYLRHGFQITDRAEQDSLGFPHPVLTMTRLAAPGERRSTA